MITKILDNSEVHCHGLYSSDNINLKTIKLNHNIMYNIVPM